MEFTKQLRQNGGSENWRLAKKLDPKTRIFAPVLVRGEEEMGVRLWQFGKEIYQEFLNLAADEEIGDYTDIVNGRDIKLITVGPEVTGTKYNKTSISPSVKSTPLSKDKNQVKEFLENQPDPKQIIKKYEFDEMKKILQEWLTSDEEESEGDIPSNSIGTEKVSSSNSQSKGKVSNSDKFKDLFEDKE